MSAPANPLDPSQGVPCHVGFATLIASAFTSFMVPTLMAAGTALFAPGPRMSAQSSTAWVTASFCAALNCQVETSPSVSERALPYSSP